MRSSGLTTQASHMEANRRVQQATQEVGEAHAAGGAFEAANAEATPTGSLYKQAREAEERKVKAQREARAAADDAQRLQMKHDQVANQVRTLEDVDDSDDELCDDPDLAAIRAARIAQLRSEHTQRAQNLARGHGQFREIVQDEFLNEVTGSNKVIVLFESSDMPRCAVMAHHLGLLAPRHVEAKFVRLDATKTPFFCSKLQIRVLPTVVMFVDGVAADRIVGFEGLIDDCARGAEDEWPTSALEERLSANEYLDYVAPVADRGDRWDTRGPGSVYEGTRRGGAEDDDEF